MDTEQLEQKYWKQSNKELRNEKSKSKYYFSDYGRQYRKVMLQILRSNIGNNWDNVYPKIIAKIPYPIKNYLLERYVTFVNDNVTIISRIRVDRYFVDESNILRCKVAKRPRNIRVFVQRLNHVYRYKTEKPKPYFKFDYDVEFRKYEKPLDELWGRIYITTGTRINNLGETVDHKTYFTKKEFIDWCERHKHTYRIKIYKYDRFVKQILETIEKREYDV